MRRRRIYSNSKTGWLSNRLDRYWIGLEPVNKISTIALAMAVLSFVVSAYSIYIGYYQADQIAHANIKPLLSIQSTNTTEDKSIFLRNFGLGTANITKIQFSKNNNISNGFARFIHLPYKAEEGWVWFFGKTSYIRAGQQLTLARINTDQLKKQKFNNSQTDEILSKWQKDIEGTLIEINYEDILGERQKPIKMKFAFPR